jgi:hypothetical protein
MRILMRILMRNFGMNLILHKSNPRWQADLDICVKHKLPLVITSLGAVAGLIDAIHSYGGIVFHDVVNATMLKSRRCRGQWLNRSLQWGWRTRRFHQPICNDRRD